MLCYYLSPSPKRRREELFRTIGLRKDIALFEGRRVGEASFLESEDLSSILFYLDIRFLFIIWMSYELVGQFFFVN